MDTASAWYSQRLKSKQNASWKRVLRVQAPYQWNLKRQRLGRTLDVGCGIGRNLKTLGPGSLGVDHNVEAVLEARTLGVDAVTVEDFVEAPPPLASFDSLLVAHVLEHMDIDAGRGLLASYLPYLKAGGNVFMICPQERGFASDPTHVRWVNGDGLLSDALALGLAPQAPRSFPLPRFAGRWFTYNEFNLLATKST